MQAVSIIFSHLLLVCGGAMALDITLISVFPFLCVGIAFNHMIRSPREARSPGS